MRYVLFTFKFFQQNVVAIAFRYTFLFIVRIFHSVFPVDMYQALLPQTEREQFDSLQNIPKFGLFLQSANGYKFIYFLFYNPFQTTS